MNGNRATYAYVDGYLVHPPSRVGGIVRHGHLLLVIEEVLDFVVARVQTVPNISLYYWVCVV